jgi:hypothetical protein
MNKARFALTLVFLTILFLIAAGKVPDPTIFHVQFLGATYAVTLGVFMAGFTLFSFVIKENPEDD